MLSVYLQKRIVLMGTSYVSSSLYKSGLRFIFFFFLDCFLIKKLLHLNHNFYILTNVKIFPFSIWKIRQECPLHSVIIIVLNSSEKKFSNSGNTSWFTFRWHFLACYKPGSIISNILQIIINFGNFFQLKDKSW